MPTIQISSVEGALIIHWVAVEVKKEKQVRACPAILHAVN